VLKLLTKQNGFVVSVSDPQSGSDFRQGLSDILPMMLAYAPIAAVWGAFAASKGLSPLEAGLMSAGVYSGAAQFVAMDLWTKALPLPLLSLTIITVGLRHILMSASVSRHIKGFSRLRASGLLFWLTDEAWALIERRAVDRAITPSYFLGVAMPLWPNWTLFSVIGAYFGELLGDTSRLGFDFAFAALFISVLAGFWKGVRTGGVLAVSSLVAVGFKLWLPGSAWYILAGGLAGMLVAVMTFRDEGKLL
jgi:4-azaleucine resistance transporter AzlC